MNFQNTNVLQKASDASTKKVKSEDAKPDSNPLGLLSAYSSSDEDE
jgi:hypothetical protein